MIFAAIDWSVRPQIFTIGTFELRWYSVLFALGFLVGYYIMQSMFKRENIKIDLLDKLTMYVILSTIVGARVGHCLFYEPETYLTAPWKMFLPFTMSPETGFRFTGFQGLASHGGALGLLVGLYFYSKKFKRPYLWILDRIAIVTAFAGACIRLGNLFNSEIYGNATSLPWGFRFLLEVERHQVATVEEVVAKHPTQIYEALAYLLVFALLMFIYKKVGDKFKRGAYLGWFFILVFTARFFIEIIKEVQVDFEEGMALNMGQWLSIPFVIAGIFLVLRKEKLAERKA